LGSELLRHGRKPRTVYTRRKAPELLGKCSATKTEKKDRTLIKHSTSSGEPS
jgi:hypothetical protein